MREPSELDVDARFLLANERTLLAWVRTALTLVAGGVAVEQLGADTRGRTVLGFALVTAGFGASVAGGLRYRAADRALRAGRLPVIGVAPYALVLLVAVVAALALAVVLLA